MATKANLIVDQGATFSTVVTLTDTNNDPIDLTNYTGAAQIRKTYTSLTATVSLGGNTGTIELGLTANATMAMASGRYVYDVEVTDASGVVSRVFEGLVTVSPNVTKI